MNEMGLIAKHLQRDLRAERKADEVHLLSGCLLPYEREHLPRAVFDRERRSMLITPMSGQIRHKAVKAAKMLNLLIPHPAPNPAAVKENE
ncbi:hypothetical protein D3C78_1531290 [compost metagenome]